MSWRQERRWGQAWTVLAAFAILSAILVDDDLTQVVLLLIGMVALGFGAGHGYRALVKESEEKGWPR